MIVVAKDREIVCFWRKRGRFLEREREVCFFGERNVFFSETQTPQHHNVVLHHTHTHTHTLTNTLTLTHT